MYTCTRHVRSNSNGSCSYIRVLASFCKQSILCLPLEPNNDWAATNEYDQREATIQPSIHPPVSPFLTSSVRPSFLQPYFFFFFFFLFSLLSIAQSTLQTRLVYVCVQASKLTIWTDRQTDGRTHTQACRLHVYVRTYAHTYVALEPCLSFNIYTRKKQEG